MSPLDNELRQTLAQHAADVDSTNDLLTGVESRARSMRRRRLSAAGVSGVAVIAAVVTVGVTVIGGNGADRVHVRIGTTPSSSASNQPSPSPTALPGSAGAMGWPLVGADPTWVQWDAVVRSLAPQLPTGFGPIGVPHAIGAGDTDGGLVAVFVVPAGDHLVAGAVLRTAPGAAVAVHDVAPDGDVPYVGVVVRVQGGGGSVDDGVVVGAPTTGQILFKLPGESAFRPVDGGADPRWATVTLGHVSAGQPVAQVRVLDGDGKTDSSTFTGPIGSGLTFPDV
jgi:hypothetical protein